jgi:HK97 family phage prohead protease
MPDEIIRREFPAELVPSGDGRTLDLRVVPFNTVARVSDDGGRTVYEEMWMPGAFDRQMSAPYRVDVLVNFEHQQGIGGVVARGTELRDTGEALDMTARMLNVPDADKALELVNEGVVGGVSLEAIPIKSERGSDGIMRRVAARLVNVALCRSPAYEGAQVMAVRESPDPEPEPIPDDPVPEPDSPRVSEAALALERIGFEPLIVRAVTRKPWNGDASRFTDEEYKRSCLIDRGGDMPLKERCSLPVLEPNGDVNANALGAAAAALSGARGGLRNVSSAQKASAARKLMRYYRQADMEPPDSLRRVAAN